MPFGGQTYHRERDEHRLNHQAQEVFDLMKDGNYRTLATISTLTGFPEASISARLRDFRKPRFGGHTVIRSYVYNGVWEYKLLIREAREVAA